jgi:hypothetical protein
MKKAITRSLEQRMSESMAREAEAVDPDTRCQPDCSNSDDDYGYGFGQQGNYGDGGCGINGHGYGSGSGFGDINGTDTGHGIAECGGSSDGKRNCTGGVNCERFIGDNMWGIK